MSYILVFIRRIPKGDKRHGRSVKRDPWHTALKAWHTALKASQTFLTEQAKSGSSAHASVAAAAAGTAGRALEMNGLDGECLHMVTGI